MADATITELAASDLDEAAWFLARESTGADPTSDAAAAASARLRWLMLENPARLDDVPLGWVLRDDRGAIVGAMTCVPGRFAVNGHRFTALMSSNYYVSPSQRGVGLGIFLRYLKLGGRFPLYCTTAGGQSGPLWERFGGFAIADQDHEMLGVAGPGAVVEEAVWRRTGSRWLARAAGGSAVVLPRGAWRRAAGDAELEELSTVEAVTAIGLPESTEVVSTVRDRAYLHWRYFSHGAQHRAMFAYRRAGAARPSMVVVERVVRGHRGQIRGLTVSDLWGPLPPEDLPLLAGLLDAKYSRSYDMLVIRGQSPARQEALCRAGFVRRGFAAPVAWCIDRAGMLPTRDWYLVPADSE